MNKPIDMQGPLEIQQKPKSELASHVVRQNSMSARDLYRIKFTRVCWKNNFPTVANGCSIWGIPGLADISAHTVFGWIVISKNLGDLFDPKAVPCTVAVRS